jgi:hypothetical protein
MKQEDKGAIYGQLLNEHTRLYNQINIIKGQNIDLTQQDKLKIQELERKQIEIMNRIKKLFD